jgi:tetratricopeptide (TPR) repeat protein
MANTHSSPFLDEEQLRDSFIDRDTLRKEFDRVALGRSTLTKRIWNITGDVGQGKSAVLRMIRKKCSLDAQIPVTYVAARRQLTEVSFLKALADGFEEMGGLKLKGFQSRFNAWDRQVARAGQGSDAMEGTAEHVAAASEKIGETTDKLLPGAKVVGEAGSLFVRLWLDIGKLRLAQTLRNPTKKLTEVFLKDIGKATSNLRVVLLIDDYEELEGLDAWVCDFLRQLTAFDVFVVIASHSAVGGLQWDGIWPDWLSHVYKEDLEPLSKEDRKRLILDAYSVLGMAADPTEVQAILEFGSASPLTCKLEVVMRKLGYKRLQRTSPGNLEQIARHFLNGIPEELRPLVEAATVLRRLDRDAIRALTGSDDFDKRLERAEPLRLLLIKNADGWTMLPSLRDALNAFLRDTKPERYSALQESSAAYYRDRIGLLSAVAAPTSAQRDKMCRWEIERLYHEFQISPSRGVTEFRQVFERTLLSAGHLDFCRALLNEVGGYDLGVHQQNWVRFYESLFKLQESSGLEQPLGTLEELRKSKELDPPLRIAILDSLAWIHFLRNATEEAKALCEECLRLCERPPVDRPGQARALIGLGCFSKKTGGSQEYFSRAAAICERLGNEFAPIAAHLNKEVGDAYRLQGSFAEAEKAILKSIDAYQGLNMDFDLGHALRTRAMLLVDTGKLRDAERLFEQSIDLFNAYFEGHPRMYEQVWPLIGLGDVALGRGAWAKCLECYQRALELSASSEFETAVAEGSLADLYCAKGEWDAALEHAERSLTLRERLGDMFGVGWVLCTKGNALMGKASYTEASESLNRGMDVMRDYGSAFVLSKLELAMAEICLRKADAAGFERWGREVYQSGVEHGYSGLLARERLLEGLAMLEASPADADVPEPAIVERLSEALTWALRHNVFLLDGILKELLGYLAGSHRHSASYKAALIRELLLHWTKAVVTGKRAEEMERNEREFDRLYLPQRPTLAGQLNRYAARLPESASGASAPGEAHLG